jgi:hypothetical protein
MQNGLVFTRKELGFIQAADLSAAGRRDDRAVGLDKHAQNIPLLQAQSIW